MPTSPEQATQFLTIRQAVHAYLQTVASGRSPRTHKAYQSSLNLFLAMLGRKGLTPDMPAAILSARHLEDFAQYLRETPYHPTGRPSKNPRDNMPITPGKLRSASSVRAGMIVGRRFLTHAHAMGAIPDLSLSALELAARNAPKVGKRLVNFPIEAAREILAYVRAPEFLAALPYPAPREATSQHHLRLKLIRLRDRAIILTLADSGLRVSELCGLRRKDINWRTRKAVIIGKGDKQAVIRFSPRSLNAIRDYHRARQTLDGLVGNLGNNPVFCRHDPGAGHKVKPLGDNGVRTLVAELVAEVFPGEHDLHITPHTFRHLFVTEVVQATGDIRRAQLMARHESIATTERYSHFAESELDETYDEVFGKS